MALRCQHIHSVFVEMTGLFELPAELRIAIYELVLCDEIDISEPVQPTLLYTNSLIKIEALKVFLEHIIAVR